MEFNLKLKQPKTWFLDLDGTLVRHNGYKSGNDILLQGTISFIEGISKEDVIIITTARSSEYKEHTISFLKDNNIRYNHIIFDLPSGERILINDMKPDGTKTAYCINLERNGGFND